MRLGEWMQTHPVLARRVVALNPDYNQRPGASKNIAGTVKAIGILLLVSAMVVTGIGYVFYRAINEEQAQKMQEQTETMNSQYMSVDLTKSYLHHNYQ